MKEDLAILFSPNEAHWQAPAQFTASGFVANAAIEAGPNNMQLRFAHGALQPEQQAIVEQRGMVDAVVVSDKGVGDAAKFQQTIPICVVSRKTRNFQSKNDTHVGQR